MRSFSEFQTTLDQTALDKADQARLRSSAAWAYLLLRPGMEFVRQRSNFILGWQVAASSRQAVSEGVSAGAVGRAGVPPLGSWMILPNLTTPATRTVLPNADALYGAAHIELDLLGPVVLSVPANLDDRYFSVSVMDAHLNNVAHIGPHWTGNEAVKALVVPPGWQGEAPEGMKLIVSPTVSACLYNRMLVRRTGGDIDRVREWQAGLRITQLSKWGQQGVVPDEVPVKNFLHPDLNETTDTFEYLSIGLAHLKRNPMVKEASWLAEMVSGAGFDRARAEENLRKAVEDGVEEGTLLLDASLATWPRDNGWMRPDPSLGLPNPYVQRSAAYQQFQIGSNDMPEATYWFNDTDTDGKGLDASGRQVYEMTFAPGQAPPIHAGGYWSLTMYNADSLLCENPINRYTVRADNPGFAAAGDGAITITLATDLPPGASEGNWLPAPDGRFRLGLRAYYPASPILEGSWIPPAVKRVLT